MPPEWLQREQVPVETGRAAQCCTAVCAKDNRALQIALMNQVDKIRQVVFTTREAMQCAFHKPYESESRRPGLTSQLPDPLVDTDSEGVGVTKSVRCEHVRVQSCQDVPSASNAAPFVSGIRGSKLWGPLITGPQHTTASC